MSQFISLEQAVEMTTLYRGEKDKILNPDFEGQNILALSETFDRDVFDTLLAKADCTAIRIYYGMDEELKVHAILVAVNDENKDILPVVSLGDDIGEQGKRCPFTCPPSSPLNE